MINRINLGKVRRIVAKERKELSKHASNKWVILALLALAQFMVILDVAIVNVALPSMARDLHLTGTNLQWVVTAYTLTFGGFLLLGGRAADLFGRRRIFISAVTAFAAMSLMAGLAKNETWIILARAFQGLAGAFMSPAALSIVLTEFKEGEERNKAMGVWGGVAAGGAAAGVLLGGILTQYLNWRWNFFVNLPIGVFVILASLRLLPHHIGEEDHKVKLDLPGAVFATGGLMSLVFGLSKAPTLGWGSATVWEFIVAGAILLAAFIWNERRAEQPLMPLSLFRIRNVLGGNVAFLVVACTMFSMFFFLTLYVQQVLGFSPVKSGVSFLPTTFVIGIMSAVVSKLVGKLGYKPLMNLGPIILAIGLFIMAHTMKVGGNYWHNVFPGLATAAIGMGLTFIPGTLAATSGVPKNMSGLASGILNTAQQVGGAIGLAILSAVAFSTVKSDALAGKAPLQAQVHGYQNGLHVGIGLAIFAAIVVFLVVKNEKVDPTQAAKAAKAGVKNAPTPGV